MSEDKVEYQAVAVVAKLETAGKHHPTGMSKFPALAQCPFYESDGRTGEYAEAGSEAHRMLAEVMGGEDVSRFVDFPHWASVAWAVRFARDLEQENGMPFDVERRVTMKSEHPHVNGVFGTCDLCMVVGGGADEGIQGSRDSGAEGIALTPHGLNHLTPKIVVMDFKTFGTGEKCHVEQLAGYAFALGCGRGITDPGTPCELYELHGMARCAKRYDMTLGDCHAMVVRILGAVAAARDAAGWGYDGPQTPVRCANEYCRYCKHYGPCEAQGALVAAVVPATVPNANLLLATREEMMARPQNVPVLMVLISELEPLVERAKENARDVIKAHGERRVLHGKDNSGLEAWTLEDRERGVAWEVKQSQGARRLGDLLGLYHGYASSHLTQEEFLENCTAQFGRLAKAIHAKTGIPVREVEASIGEYAERGEVRETMKRVK